MNVLTEIRQYIADAEITAGVYLDEHHITRTAAAFLAHHRTARAITSAAVAVALIPATTVAAAFTAGRVIDRAHETAGEGSEPRRPCVTAEADEFAADGPLTYEDFCHALDLTDGGLS